jgi:hypothetical protein
VPGYFLLPILNDSTCVLLLPAHCDAHSYKLVEEEAGEQAGIKSCRIDAEGPLCYGLLAGEKVGRILFLDCSAPFHTFLHILIMIIQQWSHCSNTVASYLLVQSLASRGVRLRL